MVIDVPRKRCRSKVASTYEPPLFSNNIDEGVFLFEPLGRTVFQQTPWKLGHRYDIITFDHRIITMNFLKLASTVLVREQFYLI